jgi:hypothetical protein
MRGGNIRLEAPKLWLELLELRSMPAVLQQLTFDGRHQRQVLLKGITTVHVNGSPAA